jgi:hypothetical protein
MQALPLPGGDQLRSATQPGRWPSCAVASASQGERQTTGMDDLRKSVTALSRRLLRLEAGAARHLRAAAQGTGTSGSIRAIVGLLGHTPRP